MNYLGNSTNFAYRKSIDFQYLATLVWNKDDPHFVPHDGLGKDIDYGLLQKYFDVNEIFELHDITVGDAKEEQRGCDNSNDFPELYVSTEGKIFRLLDDNFGILRVGDNLVLFDVCDFWIDSNTTASRRGLTIGQIVGLGSTVVFHACRLEGQMAKVQYLANAVWKMGLEEFKESRKFLPNPIAPSEVAEEKIRIFRQVVATVSPSLPFFGGRRPAVHVLNGKTGVVETTFVDERGVFLSGVMNVSGLGTAGQEKMRCAFVREHYSGAAVPQAGFSYMVNIRRVVRKYSWSDKVPYVALAVYPMYSNVKEEERDKAGEKEEMALRQFDDAHRLVTRSNRRCPLDDEHVKKTYQIRSRSKSPSGENTEAKNHDEKKSMGIFKCLTSRTTGIMQDIRDPSILIYFELEDLIGKEKKHIKGLTTWDVIKLMCNMAGVKVCYKAGEMNSQTIRYAVDRNGLCLSIAGGKRLPKHLEFLDHVKLEKKHLRKTVDLPDRMRRFKEAECNLQFPDRLKATEQVRKEDETEKKPDLIAVKGKVRVILNESFSLLWGPIEESDVNEIQYYCLFDTYDLLVSGKQSAADKGVSMSSVVKVGDVLTYNACLMAKRKVVPYLATSVWNGEDRAFDVPPMTKANIQSDKINVYGQVVDSCMPFIEKREREEYAEENKKLETAQRQAKEEEIKIKARELRSIEQKERERREREVKDLAQKQLPIQGEDGLANVSSFDLVDWRTKGSIETEKCDLFAILRLWNNKHALLSTHRVWINDKPKFGEWKALHLPFFRSQNVSARKVEGFEEFEYQVIFSHAGMYKKSGLTFDYPPAMASWIKPLCLQQTLDSELTIYKTRHGTKKASPKAQENPPPPPGT